MEADQLIPGRVYHSRGTVLKEQTCEVLCVPGEDLIFIRPVCVQGESMFSFTVSPHAAVPTSFTVDLTKTQVDNLDEIFR